jgi:hypothetical protein
MKRIPNSHPDEILSENHYHEINKPPAARGTLLSNLSLESGAWCPG